MNKYAQWLAILLINREIRKYENNALKRMRKGNNFSGKRRVEKLVDYLTAGTLDAIGNKDGRTYNDWLRLKNNIEGINGPWAGVFAYHWTRHAKDEKHREPFPPVPPGEPRPKNEFDDGLDEEFAKGTPSEELVDKWIADWLEKHDKDQSFEDWWKEQNGS